MLTGKLVLVVDDEAGIRALASRALLAAAAEVCTACDGQEAINVMKIRPADLAIIDIVMPEKEGVETIIAFKKQWPDCKIIAISGGGRTGPESFLTLASALGADATMKKPLVFPELIRIAMDLLFVGSGRMAG